MTNQEVLEELLSSAVVNNTEGVLNFSNSTEDTEKSEKKNEKILENIESTEQLPQEDRENLKDFLSPANFPQGFDEWSFDDRQEWFEKRTKALKINVPQELVFMNQAYFKAGDCGDDRFEKPEWLDMEKFQKGQEFAMKNIFGVSFGLMMGVFMIYSFKDDLKPMIITRKTSTPYNAFQRYLKTLLIFRHWYTTDPFTKGTPAYETMKYVRKQHQNVRKLLESKSNKQIDELTKISNPMCPLRNILVEDLKKNLPETSFMERPYDIVQDSLWRPKGLHQGSMVITQFSLMGLVVFKSKFLGIHATEEELDAFCHTWRALGYLLGIDDNFNFCRGSLEDVRNRSKALIERWIKSNFRSIAEEWEHMTRCVFEGINYYMPILSFEAVVLHFARILDVNLPLFKSLVSYRSFIEGKALGFLFQNLMALSVVRWLVNKYFAYAMLKAEKYSPEKLMKLQERSKKTLQTNLIKLST